MSVKISKKNLLSIADKKIFDQYLSLEIHELSVYNFANIYVWNSLFEIFWYLIDDSLCVFFNNAGGCFMYLSPLTENINQNIIKQCFKIMDEYNSNHTLSRIENIPEQEIKLYKNMGLVQKDKSGDYLYLRTDIAELKGNAYKSKRADCNYFTKNYKFEYRTYSQTDEQACILLLKHWIAERKLNHDDQLYRYMLDDIFFVQHIALKKYAELGLIGRVVLVEGKIAGYSFGYELNPDTFCIMFEVTDNHFKGIPQFIFRQFVQEMKDYKYINTMDDSGLENLIKVKLSYKPDKLIINSIITREL